MARYLKNICARWFYSSNNIKLAQSLHTSSKCFRYKPDLDIASKITPIIDEKGQEFKYVQDSYSKKQKKVKLKILQDALNINNVSAIEIADRWKDLYKVDIPRITENIKILIDNGITQMTIIKYPFLLGVDNTEKKIDVLKQLPYEINETVPLMFLSLGKLINLVDKEFQIMKSNSGGRIHFLTDKLKCSVDTACYCLIKYPFLEKYAFSRIENNLQSLNKYGITLEQILNDVWVLAYTSRLIENRLEIAKQSQVVKLKTWMVRCQPSVMNNCIQRKQSNKSILGSNSVAEYLSERLDCTKEEAKMIITKNKPLQTKSIVRLKEILDWLYSQGFQPYQIQRVPRILLHSMDTIKKRVKMLSNIGYTMDSLVYILKSKKDFQKFYESVEKKMKMIEGSNN